MKNDRIFLYASSDAGRVVVEGCGNVCIYTAKTIRLFSFRRVCKCIIYCIIAHVHLYNVIFVHFLCTTLHFYTCVRAISV